MWFTNSNFGRAQKKTKKKNPTDKREGPAESSEACPKEKNKKFHHGRKLFFQVATTSELLSLAHTKKAEICRESEHYHLRGDKRTAANI